MLKISNLIIGTLVSLSAYGFAGNTYSYTVNLVEVTEDKVHIDLNTPEIEKDTIIFHLPKIVPGTYKISDYGRFVSEFKAYNKRDKELEAVKIDENSWKIINAREMARISYWVDDTFDADLGDTEIYEFNGTNIDKGKIFIISPGGYFGYFDGLTDLPFEIKFIRPENFYGSTGLVPSQTGISVAKNKDYKKLPRGTQLDLFEAENYNRLIDSPFMYNAPDTTVIDVAGTQVLVSVYSPGKLVKSNFVAENIKKLLNAQKDYLGGKLPVNKYAFIMYFEDLNKIGKYQGALEHSYSSFYYLPEVPQQSLVQTLRDFCSHEFFHVVTPLSIHSEEIEYFDYNKPEMSEHLWLYEGVTEYFAGHVQLKYGLITLEDYLKMIRLKIASSKSEYDDTLPFTELSKHTLDKYSGQYDNVYQKGALIGLCLDIKLRELSSGKYGLQNLMADLSAKYGKSRPFKDDELFDVIEALTYPEIGEFLRNCVGGIQPLPLEKVLESVGITYTPYKQINTFTLGSFGIALDGNNIVVDDVSRLDPFGRDLGYKKGDVLIKLQGEEIPINPYEINDFIQRILDEMVEGEEFTVTVHRKENNKKKEVELSAKAVKLPAFEMHVLEVNPDVNKDILTLRHSWIDP